MRTQETSTDSLLQFQPGPVDIWTRHQLNLLGPSAAVMAKLAWDQPNPPAHLQQLLSTHHRRAHAAHTWDAPGTLCFVDQGRLHHWTL